MIQLINRNTYSYICLGDFQATIYLNYDGIFEQRDVFLLLWSLLRVLWVVPQVGIAAMAVGFGFAGWRSGTLSKWLVALGLILGATTLLTCFGMVSVVTNGWALTVQNVAIVLTLLWLLSMSVLMVRR